MANEGSEIKKSSILNEDEVDALLYETKNINCSGCDNNCILTINKFSNNKTFISGNRCENFTGNEEKTTTNIPNIYKEKYELIFNYQPLELKDAKRGEIGIPRVLNMYENYPFWFTFFTSLGYRVILSDATTKHQFESGMKYITSDTLCYPAKIVHGHIVNLIEDLNVKTIFYPNINYEKNEDEEAKNHYNCPIVATYPEVIRVNQKEYLKQKNVTLISPFLPFDDKKKLTKNLSNKLNLPFSEVKHAVDIALKEESKVKEKIRNLGDKYLKQLEKEDKIGIVICARPYTLDPEINKGIDRLINSLGFYVFTEDSIAHKAKNGRTLRVLDQWMYHSRLYKAADVVSNNERLELLQLNSFGCGPDSIVADQVLEILKKNHKLFTLIKIDEGSSQGAFKIRLRSLKVALEKMKNENKLVNKYSGVYSFKRKHFLKSMKDYTILIPQMSPFHFSILESAIRSLGYNAKLLSDVSKEAVDSGLKYINNDSCYPTIVSLGQILNQITNDKTLNLNKTAIFMSQTGGGCRASNYVGLLRKALEEMNLPNIPVISVSLVGLEKNEGFKPGIKFLKRALMSLIFGDLLLTTVLRVRPYEVNKGETNALHKRYETILKSRIGNMSIKEFKKILKEIAIKFDKIPTRNIKKPRVGVVGEILVKYHPTANNEIIKVIEDEGGEAVVPGIIDFFLYGMRNKKFSYKHLSGTLFSYLFSLAGISLIEYFRNFLRSAFKATKKFHAPKTINEVAKEAKKILSLGNQYGEGWLLTGEMIELINDGVMNIVCLQPFGCLPNHITGKGMLNALRKYNESANILPIDYDPGASFVNQLNRIKLMMSNAKV